MDLRYAPVPVNMVVLHSLRHQLHTYKKCFSGKDFVDTIIAIGNHHNGTMERESVSNTPSPAPQSFTPSPHSFSPTQRTRITSQVMSPTAQIIVYDVHYATEVAQYLIGERILLPVVSELPESTTHTPHSSYSPAGVGRGGEQDVVARDHQHLVGSFERASAVDTSSQVLVNGLGISSLDSPQVSHTHLHSQARLRSHRVDPDTHVFRYSSQAMYKFADVEDVEADKLFQSRILSSVSYQQRQRRGGGGGERHSRRGLRANGGEDILEAHRARNSMAFLILDLLAQRAHKEKRVRQFYRSPRTMNVVEQRRHGDHDTNCDQLFKM